MKRALITGSTLFICIGLAIEVCSIVLTFTSAYLVERSDEQQAQANFAKQVERGMAAAQERLHAYQLALVAGAGLFNASDKVNRQEWRTFVDTLNIDQNYPGISGFGFIRNVPQDQFDTYLAEQRQAIADFTVRTLATPPTGNRYIIEYIEPLQQNRPALGLDIGSNPLRRRAADAAMQYGRAELSNPIVLVQDAGKKPGFLMLQPVYKNGDTPTAEDRQEHCLGWTYAPFIGEKVMAGIAEIAGQGVEFAIYDGAIDEKNLIYDGTHRSERMLNTTREVKIGRLQWVFSWTSPKPPSTNAWWVMLTGLATSTGLLIVMLLLHRSSHRALRAQLQAQSQLESNNEELIKARQIAEDLADEARSASLAKSMFMAQMSHELRTPLNAIIGFSRQIHKRTDGKVKNGIERVLSNGEHLLELINSILDLAKIESGKASLNLDSIDPDEVCAEVCSALETLATEKQLKLTVHYLPEPQAIEADRMKLKQILTNLIANAVKYTNTGTITVINSVDTNAELGLCYTCIIKDTGPGITEEDIPKLFQAFEQGSAQNNQVIGTGLGLMVAHKFAKLHGGGVELISTSSTGSTFGITIPFERPKEPKTKATSRRRRLTITLLGSRQQTEVLQNSVLNEEFYTVYAAESVKKLMNDHRHLGSDVILADRRLMTAEDEERLQTYLADTSQQTRLIKVPQQDNPEGLALDPINLLHYIRSQLLSEATNVLIVEDNPDTRTLMAEALTPYCENLRFAHDFRSAEAEIQQNPPLIAIIDLILPDQNGEELAIKLREAHQDLPIIAYTAKEMSNQEIKALEKQRIAVLNKGCYDTGALADQMLTSLVGKGAV